MGLCNSTPAYIFATLRGGSCDVHDCKRFPEDGVRCSYHYKNGLVRGQRYSRAYKDANGRIFIQTIEEGR